MWWKHKKARFPAAMTDQLIFEMELLSIVNDPILGLAQ